VKTVRNDLTESDAFPAEKDFFTPEIDLDIRENLEDPLGSDARSASSVPDMINDKLVPANLTAASCLGWSF